MHMLLRDPEIESVIANTMALECSQMRLEQLGTGAGRVLHGAGAIRQRPDGGLEFTLYARDSATSDDDSHWPPPGRVFPETAYYHLEATELGGRVWTSARVLPQFSGAASGHGVVVTGRLRDITAIYNHGEHNYSLRIAEKLRRVTSFDIFVPGELSVPANEDTTTTKRGGGNRSSETRLNIARFKAADCRFVVTREPRFTRIQCLTRRKRGFPAGMDSHVVDALAFLLALPVRPRVTVAWNNATERATVHGFTTDTTQARIPRPVPGNRASGFDDTWRLFDRYLRYITAGGADAAHSLSTQWRGILRASTGSTETLALVASVAVERILTISRGPKHQPSKGDLEAVAWSEEATAHLTGLDCPPRIVKRLTGLFGQFTRMRTLDALHAMVREGSVQRDLVDQWHAMRNTFAHGGDVNGDPQELIYHCGAVITLLYQLVFSAVGYSGEATKWGPDGVLRTFYPPHPDIPDRPLVPPGPKEALVQARAKQEEKELDARLSREAAAVK
jgi:hypothetical protein